MMNRASTSATAGNVKVPAGYGSHFKSFDGKERKFLAESNGGPSWYTEYNVLAGSVLALVRPLRLFRHAASPSGRVERGLPLALRRCGYETLSLYPAFGAFMSARSFQTTTGIEHFYDAHDLGAKDVEPDSFFYDSALKLMSERRRAKAALHVRLSRRQSFPLGDQIPPRPDARTGARPATSPRSTNICAGRR